MKPHVDTRIDERPWSLEPDPSCGSLLSILSKRILQDPPKTVYGVSDDLYEDLFGPMLTVRHGDLQVHLPVIDGWPLRRLSPADVAAVIDAVADACFGDGDHEAAILPYVTAAVAIAIGEGTMPTDADTRSGGYAVEMCMDGETDRPALYVHTLTERGPDAILLPTPVGVGVPVATIPCSIVERDPDDAGITSVLMSFRCTDSDGIVCEGVEVDSMQVLRLASLRSDSAAAPTHDPRDHA